MTSLVAGVVGAAAVLLVLAGAAKVVDPSRTAGALAALRWPSLPTLVRVGAAAELALGAVTLVVGGPLLAMLVAISYLGFALFVMAALRAGTPVATCGCFGQVDTPPRPAHVVVDGLLALGAVGAAAVDAPGLLEASWMAWVVAAVVTPAALMALSSSQPQPSDTPV